MCMAANLVVCSRYDNPSVVLWCILEALGLSHGTVKGHGATDNISLCVCSSIHCAAQGTCDLCWWLSVAGFVQYSQACHAPPQHDVHLFTHEGTHVSTHMCLCRLHGVNYSLNQVGGVCRVLGTDASSRRHKPLSC